MLNTILTNKGRERFSDSLSGGEKINILKVAFGDKGSTPNAEHSINATKLINERFRLNIDSLYYPPVTEDNNAIIKITASLLPEQSETMDPIYVREFGLVDINGDFIFIGDTVTTLTKEDGTGAGIEFEFYVTIPTPDKLVKVVLGQTSTDFNDAYKLKLEAIEESATKNSKDSFLLNRENHTGKQSISTVNGLTEALESLKGLLDSKTSKFKGTYSDHATFIESNRKYPDGEEPIAGNVTGSFVDDNYLNNSTSTLWYFLGEDKWFDSGKKVNDELEALNNVVTDLTNSISDTKEVFKNGSSLGIFNTIDKLPTDPNIDADTMTYNDETLYYAFVIETLSTWVFKLDRNIDDEIIGGSWVNLNSNVTNRFLEMDNKLNTKVDIVPGKTLSSNDYTNLEKEKLSAIEPGAQVNKNVIDNLTSTSKVEPLSANQGKVLKGIIDNIDENVRNLIVIVSSDDTTLDEIQEIVNYIKLNRSTLEALSIPSIAGLENALQLLENKKVDKIDGMSLSKNNLTDELKSSIEEIKVKDVTLDTTNKKLQVKLTNNSVVSIDINQIVINNTIDDLSSSDGTKPLSAKQGKILNDTKLDKTGGKLIGPIVGTKEKKVTLGADNNIDLAEGNLFIKNVTANITFTLSNISVENNIVHSFILEIVNGGNFTITWFNNIKWDDGIAPTLSTSGTDILSFYTHDGGVTWRGFTLAIDSK